MCKGSANGEEGRIKVPWAWGRNGTHVLFSNIIFVIIVLILNCLLLIRLDILHSAVSNQAVGELISQKLRPLEACSVPGILRPRLVSPACMQGLTQTLRDFPGVPVAKNPLSNAGDVVSIPGQGTKIPRGTGQLSAPAPHLRSPLRPRACAPRLEKPRGL